MEQMIERMAEVLRPIRRDIAVTIHVWNAQQFATVIEPFSRRTAAPVSFYGVEITEDRALPYGWVEFRNQFGEVIQAVDLLACQ